MILIYFAILLKSMTSAVDITEWDLAFIGHTGNGQSIMAAWNKPLRGKCAPERGCIPLGTHPYLYENPETHKKSPLVDEWKNINVQQVMIEFFNRGRSSAYAVFDAKGSDSRNWFTPERLQQSSFYDLFNDGCFRVFRLLGKRKRRFLILQDMGKCEDDRGWMAVVDGPSGKCKWHTHDKYPQFIYGRNHHKCFFEKMDFGVADCMAIYVKLENHKGIPEPEPK